MVRENEAIATVIILLRKVIDGKSTILLYGLELVVSSFLYQTPLTLRIRTAEQIMSNNRNMPQITASKDITAKRVTAAIFVKRPNKIANIKSRNHLLKCKRIQFWMAMLLDRRKIVRKGFYLLTGNNITNILEAEPKANRFILDETLNSSGNACQVMDFVSQLNMSNQGDFLKGLSCLEIETSYAPENIQTYPLCGVRADFSTF